MTSLADGNRPVGLRERKKARTRATIRDHAMRLFQEQGYPATTIEQIADAAEVSPSTFFRYFPSKEAVVLADDLDPELFQALRDQPEQLSLLAAVRAAIHEIYQRLTPQQWRHEQNRHALIFAVPELRAAMIDEFARTSGELTAAIADRVGRPREDFEVKVFTGALLGALAIVTYTWMSANPQDYLDRLDAALSQLERGFSF